MSVLFFSAFFFILERCWAAWVFCNKRVLYVFKSKVFFLFCLMIIIVLLLIFRSNSVLCLLIHSLILFLPLFLLPSSSTLIHSLFGSLSFSHLPCFFMLSHSLVSFSCYICLLLLFITPSLLSFPFILPLFLLYL